MRPCLPVSLRAGRHPLSRHSVSVYFVRAKKKERQLPLLKDFPPFPPGVPHLSPAQRCLPRWLSLSRILPTADIGGLPRTKGGPPGPQGEEAGGLHLEPPDGFFLPHPASRRPSGEKPHQAESFMIGLLLLSGSSPYIVPAARRWQETQVPSRKMSLSANSSPHPQLLRRDRQKDAHAGLPQLYKATPRRPLAWGASRLAQGLPQPVPRH